MKNSIIFLCSLLVTPIYFAASGTVGFTFDTKRLPQTDGKHKFKPLPVSMDREENRKAPRNPLETGEWMATPENQQWENKIKALEAEFSLQYSIPSYLVNSSCRITNNSGKPVNKTQQLIAFRRFMDAIQENNVSTREQAQSVLLLINDNGEPGSPVLKLVISFQKNFSYEKAI